MEKSNNVIQEINHIENTNYSKTENQNTIKDIKFDNNNLTFFQNFKLFCNKNFDYIISCLIITFIYVLILIFNKCIPFGKNTIIFSDSYEQIASFLNHIFNVFEGKSTLFYTNYFGKGINIFSTLLYMFLNPFYLIVFILGRANIDLSLTISVLFMLIFNGVISIYFTRKYFKNINIKLRTLLSLCFVFSTYLSFNIAFITWLIYPALLLLLIDKFIFYLNTGKIKGLIAIYLWYIINCFSVGISTSLLLLLISVLYIFLCVDKLERYKKFTGLFVSICSTALICLIILLPAVLDFFITGRSNSNSILKNLLVISYFSPINKLGLIFSSLAILLFTIYYFIKCSRKDKFNKFLLLTCLILFLPVIFDAMMKLICFSSYKGFSGRFYFLNEIFLFLISLKLFDNDFNLKESTSNKTAKIIHITLLSIFSLVIIILLTIFINNVSSAIKFPIYNGNSITLFTFIVFLILGLTFIITKILNNKNKLSLFLSKITIAIILSISLVVNCLLFAFNCNGNYTQYDEICTLTNSVNTSGNFKIANCSSSEKYYNFYSENLRNTNVFTSLISDKTLNPNIDLGYYAGDVLVQNSTGNLIADSILGINYYVSNRKLERPYLLEISKSENYFLYKNTLSTTGAFKLDSNFEFTYENSPIEIFENLKNHFGIEGALFEEITISLSQFIDSENITKLRGEYTPAKDGILYLQSFFIYEDNKNSNDIDNLIFGVENDYAMQDVSFINASETYKFNLTNYKETKIEALFLNYDVAKQICEKLIENQAEFSYTKKGYNVIANVKQNETLYVSVPNIDGLNYSVKGVEIEASEFLGGFTAFSLNSDFTNNQIKLEAKYTYPNTKIWVITSIIFIILLIGILTLYYYTKFKHIEKLISYAMLGLCVAIIVVVYCFGALLAICDIAFQMINMFS